MLHLLWGCLAFLGLPRLLHVQLGKQLQRLQQRLSRSSADLGAAAAYDSPTGSAAAAADSFKPDGLDAIHTQQQAGAAADEDGPFAGVQQQPPPGAYVSRAYAGGQAVGPDYGQVPARGWYLHGCVIMAALGVRWWLLNQTDPLQRKVMLVIIWPVSVVLGKLAIVMLRKPELLTTH
jgi:hypothetical protein